MIQTWTSIVYITKRAFITLYKHIMVQLFCKKSNAEILLVVPIVTRVGFEPTKHDAVDLKSTPFDRSGTLPGRHYVMSSSISIYICF